MEGLSDMNGINIQKTPNIYTDEKQKMPDILLMLSLLPLSDKGGTFS